MVHIEGNRVLKIALVGAALSAPLVTVGCSKIISAIEGNPGIVGTARAASVNATETAINAAISETMTALGITNFTATPIATLADQTSQPGSLIRPGGYGKGTLSPSAAPTATETATAIPTATNTETSTATPTRTATTTATARNTVTPTETNTPTNTASPTPIETPTATETATAIPTATNTETSTAAPTRTATTTATARNTVTPTETNTPTNNEVKAYIRYLEGLGITVNLPREGWPVTPEQAAEVLESTDPTHAIKAEQLTPIIETLPDGSKVWNGWMMGEPAFPMKDNITYDSRLHVHIDTNTNEPEFDPQKIFKSFNDLTPEEKADFKNRLVDIKINESGVAVFANKGGIVRDGDTENNTHFFLGTPDSEVKGLEQFTIIPVSDELCVYDPELSGATRSFRQAAVEFRDNKDAREGRATVKWFNPETNRFEKLDGRMIAQLSKQGTDVSVLEHMPANTPLSPEDMAKRFGGKAENWVVNTQTWEWFYEAFAFQPGVQYLEGVGAVDQYGTVLVGAEQANSATSKIFNFNVIDSSALVTYVRAPKSYQATLFVRIGTKGNLDTRNHSFYTWGHGDILLAMPSAEQMTFMPDNPGWCAPADVPDNLAARVKTLADEQPDSTVTAEYWNGSAFVEVLKK